MDSKTIFTELALLQKNYLTNQMNFKTKFTILFKSYKRAGFAVLPAMI
jgi:hypothetical protein